MRSITYCTHAALIRRPLPRQVSGCGADLALLQTSGEVAVHDSAELASQNASPKSSRRELGRTQRRKFPDGDRLACRHACRDTEGGYALLSGAAPCFAVPADGVKFSPHDF